MMAMAGSCAGGALGVRQEWMKGLAMGGAVDIIRRPGSRLVQSS
jgi:hypothetical protein